MIVCCFFPVASSFKVAPLLSAISCCWITRTPSPPSTMIPSMSCWRTWARFPVWSRLSVSTTNFIVFGGFFFRGVSDTIRKLS